MTKSSIHIKEGLAHSLIEDVAIKIKSFKNKNIVKSVTPLQEAKTKHPYVEINPKICNGSSVLKGTRVRVVDIAIEYEYLNQTPDEIISAHPHLKLEEIHDALSYYYENRAQLDKKIKEDKQFIQKLSKSQKGTWPPITPKRIKIYANESVNIAIVEGLKRRGIQAFSAKDVGKLGLTDEQQLQTAIQKQAVIFTHDVDFIKIASTNNT